MSEILTELPESFVAEFAAELEGSIPNEKAQVELRQMRNKRIMDAAGSVCVEGVGQLKTSMDARLWFRLFQEHGKHEGWLDDFLCDNPSLCAPGFKPKQRSLRHSKSFVSGKPV